MTDKLTLTSFASLQNDVSATTDLNNNNSAIVAAVNNTLSRDGTSPNTMGSSLDMNSNRILNLPAPLNVNEPMRVADAGTMTAGGSIVVNPLPTGGTTGQVLTKTSNVNFAANWQTPGVTSAVGKTLTVNNSLTLAGTDGKVLTLNNNVTTTGGGSLTLSIPVTTTQTTPIVNSTLAGYDTNDNFFGGTGGIGSLGLLTSGFYNTCIGHLTGRAISSGHDNIIIGSSCGANITTGFEHTIVGTGAGNLVTNAQGHTLIGAYAGSQLDSPSNPTTWNTFVGHSAGYLATTAGGCIAVGRGAGGGFRQDSDCVAIGHGAAFFYTLGVNTQCTAIGNQAGGAPTDGTGTNWQGSGKTYYGMMADSNTSYIGDSTGKSTAAGRTNSFALGSFARIPARSNVGWMGNNLVSVGTLARLWDGVNLVQLNTASTTITLSTTQLLTGILEHSGSPVGTVTATTPTAQQIVQAGPGNDCEVPVSTIFYYANKNTGQSIVLSAGSGVTVSSGTSSPGAVIGSNIQSGWRIIVTNSTLGAEAVTIYRVN